MINDFSNYAATSDYRGDDYRTSDNPASSPQKEAGGFHILITIINSHNKTKNASLGQKQRTVDGIKNSKSKTIHSNMESKIASKKPQVRRGRIKDTNETIRKNNTEVAKDQAEKKMIKNRKVLVKPGKIAKHRDKEDNKSENKSKNENHKEGKFRVQILKNKIKGKLQSIKENLAATKELKNQADPKQNLSTESANPLRSAIPTNSKKKKKSSKLGRQKTGVTTDYTETDKMEDYIETEEQDNVRDDKGPDYTPDYEEQSKEPEYMADYTKRTKVGRGKIKESMDNDGEYQLEGSSNEEYHYEDIPDQNDGKNRDEGYEYQNEAVVQTTDINKNPKQIDGKVEKQKHGEFFGIAIGSQNEKRVNGVNGYGVTQSPGNVLDMTSGNLFYIKFI